MGKNGDKNTGRKSFIRERKGASKRAVPAPAVDVYRMSFKDALNAFVIAKKAEGMRPRTISDYHKHMQYLTEFLTEHHPEVTTIQDLTPTIIRDYINYMKYDRVQFDGIEGRDKGVKGLSDMTINVRLRTLKAMCRFWHAEGYLPTNPAENIKLMKMDEDEDSLEGFTNAELKRLFGVLDTRQFSHYRDKVMFLLLLDTGIRVNELVNVKITWLDQKQLTLTVPAEISKNRKARDIPVTRKVMKMLLELHEETKEYFGETEYLFLTAYGDLMTADAFRRRLWKYAKKAGLKRATPHMFRHTFARDYLLNGGDVFTLQRILDHADIATTRRYVQMDTEHIKAQHAKFSPAHKYL